MDERRSALIVMAAGSVIKEPRTGPRVSTVNQKAVREPPRRSAILNMIASANFRIGRVAASIIITTTNMGSVKFTS